jgi:hypothetical protein
MGTDEPRAPVPSAYDPIAAKVEARQARQAQQRPRERAGQNPPPPAETSGRPTDGR